MNAICRLCFVFTSEEQMQTLDDNNKILSKISICFSIKLIMKDILPNRICNTCVNKINIVYKFHREIMDNEQKLLLYLKNGEPLKNILNKRIHELKVDVEYSKIKACKDLKVEECNIYSSDQYFSSDDDLTLSSMKKEKDSPVVEKKYKTEPPSNAQKNKISKSLLRPENSMHLTNNVYPTKNNKCLTCFSIFESKIELLTHYSSLHGEVKKNKEYTIETNDGNKRYKCTECDKVYEKKKSIVDHVIIHQKQRPYICNMCGRTYKTAAEIIRHGRVHGGDRLLCPQNCGYTTVYRGAMKLHIKRHGEKPDYKYTCEKCGKGFNVKTWHDQHQNVHTGVKPYVCDICGLAFHMDRYLTSHRSAVHPQSSDVKRYVCLHCQLPCDTRRSLTLHMEVHGIKASFLCDTCGKVMTSAENLKFHEKSEHLGIKPYTCSLCNKSFAKKFNLKLHERTHSGERPYACTTCGKSYVQRSTLLRHHRRAHADSQKCTKCETRFSSRNELGMHVKTCL